MIFCFLKITLKYFEKSTFFCDIKFYYLNISVSRVEILSGKPDFPTVVWGVGNKLVRPRLGSLVTTNSWLLFNLLKMEGTQVLLFFLAP